MFASLIAIDMLTTTMNNWMDYRHAGVEATSRSTARLLSGMVRLRSRSEFAQAGRREKHLRRVAELCGDSQAAAGLMELPGLRSGRSC